MICEKCGYDRKLKTVGWREPGADKDTVQAICRPCNQALKVRLRAAAEKATVTGRTPTLPEIQNIPQEEAA